MADSFVGTITYVTDLEGDIDLWHRYVEASEVLRRVEDGNIELLGDDTHFVYGGDVVDHKPGDLRILEDLVALKKLYPDRVHLICGNRDVNKLRLAAELSAAHRDAWPLSKHPGVYWYQAGAPAKKLSEEELAADTPELRLKWILQATMGAASAFEARRQELSIRAGGSSIDDDMVVKSFVEYAQPGGLLFEYLKHSRLAVILGCTLFLHAGLPRNADDWIPGWIPAWKADEPAKQGLPLLEWIEELEALREAALQQCEAATPGAIDIADAWSMQGGYVHEHPGCALIQYSMRDMPGGQRQASVVYNGWLGDDDYLPIQPDDATLKWLCESGVARIVSGHLPHGDSPLIHRVAMDVTVITADITYAHEVTWAGDDNTDQTSNKAVCEVLLGPNSREGKIHGCLDNGTPFEARLDDDVVGRITTDGWRVKGRASGKLLLSRNKKWKFQNRLADESEVEFVTLPLPSLFMSRWWHACVKKNKIVTHQGLIHSILLQVQAEVIELSRKLWNCAAAGFC